MDDAGGSDSWSRSKRMVENTAIDQGHDGWLSTQQLIKCCSRLNECLRIACVVGLRSAYVVGSTSRGMAGIDHSKCGHVD